ncbi:hypothetical protein GGX14DRAFT_567582 [Mycena pura]|uniref:Uncharacterized protein n=1 Tax=Mycena pura TaxID=153505 RepID=A0AAD6VB92_9AGAR|nr:hypothetical protein GGX14DRAFT_567582 [Mycena pura]
MPYHHTAPSPPQSSRAQERLRRRTRPRNRRRSASTCRRRHHHRCRAGEHSAARAVQLIGAVVHSSEPAQAVIHEKNVRPVVRISPRNPLGRAVEARHRAHWILSPGVSANGPPACTMTPPPPPLPPSIQQRLGRARCWKRRCPLRRRAAPLRSAARRRGTAAQCGRCPCDAPRRPDHLLTPRAAATAWQSPALPPGDAPCRRDRLSTPHAAAALHRAAPRRTAAHARSHERARVWFPCPPAPPRTTRGQAITSKAAHGFPTDANETAPGRLRAWCPRAACSLVRRRPRLPSPRLTPASETSRAQRRLAVRGACASTSGARASDNEEQDEEQEQDDGQHGGMLGFERDMLTNGNNADHNGGEENLTS